MNSSLGINLERLKAMNGLLTIEDYLRRSLNEKQKLWLKNKVTRSSFIGWLFQRNLMILALLYQTDKWGIHRYAQHYQKHFWRYRKRKVNLLEIGVGGHSDPNKGGASLRMWKTFFQKGKIYGVDVFDKSPHEENRIQIYQGSQNDPEFLRRVASDIGQLDIIIDDGSHVNEHVLTSFHTLYPLLRDGGIYVIEDTQTAYWPAFGGSEDPNSEGTSMALARDLITGLNWEEFQNRPPGLFDKCVRSVSFYHNLIFIEKGRNQEGSNKALSHAVHAE